MASPEFVVHKASLDQNEQSYLVGTNPSVTNGFQPNTYAYAYAVNAILHESSLITTALANMINASSTVITPNDDVNDVKTAFTNYLNAFVIPEATHAASATTADKTQAGLTIFQNNSSVSSFFDGSNSLTMYIYAPNSIGSNNQILCVKDNAVKYSNLSISSSSISSTREYYDMYISAITPNTTQWLRFSHAGSTANPLNVRVSGETELDKKLTIIKNSATSTDTAFDIFDDQNHVMMLDMNYRGDIDSQGTVTAVSFTATSDIRKKDNITDYAPSKSILDLPIKQFDFKSNGSHHIGCIAQDLQKIAPELVHEDDEGYLTIEESKLVYLLLDEVKKLRKELDELKGSK